MICNKGADKKILQNLLFFGHLKCNSTLRYASYRIGFPMCFIDHDYSHISGLLKIPTLESARVRSGILFLYKIINYYIDCSQLLQEINISVPSRFLRNVNNNYFFIPIIKNNILLRSPIHRISLDYNDNSNLLDIYNVSLSNIFGLSKKLLIYK